MIVILKKFYYAFNPDNIQSVQFVPARDKSGYNPAKITIKWISGMDSEFDGPFAESLWELITLE